MDDKETMTRVERRQKRTRENLVAAIRKLTAEKGVEAVTVRDIADEADISLGGFYNHFPSKEDLLHEAVREVAFQSGELIDGINRDSEDVLEMIAKAFAIFDGLIKSDPILGWFIVRVSGHEPELTQTLRDRFTRDLELGVERGQFDLANTDIALTLAEASFIAFFRARLLGEANSAAVPEFITMVLRMLGADGDAAQAAASRVWDSTNDDKESS